MKIFVLEILIESLKRLINTIKMNHLIVKCHQLSLFHERSWNQVVIDLFVGREQKFLVLFYIIRKFIEYCFELLEF